MWKVFLLLSTLVFLPNSGPEILLPIKTANRKSLKSIQLTEIGEFGLTRKSRPTVKEHLHTGIDLKRPSNNYQEEWIYPLAEGVVISKRDDGPYAQLIIAHNLNSTPFWTVYEHIAGIKVNVNDEVDPHQAIARFMNKAELHRHGWQFDHFHLEVLKGKPIPLKPSGQLPQRFYNSYTLQCYTEKELQRYFHDPIEFLKTSWAGK